MAIRASQRLIGIDGCRGGWIVVSYPRGMRDQAEVAVHRDFAAVLAAVSLRATKAESTIGIDMPIGLPAIGRPGGRTAEHAVRRMIGPRRHSVFGIPARAAVEVHGQGYAKVCEIARQTSAPPRAPSIQACHIFPRIMEIDAALRGDAELAAAVFEVHPELCFRLMNGAPLDQPKKRNGSPWGPGMVLRRDLLLQQGYSANFLDGPPPRGAARDDFFDACAAAWSAARIADGDALVFPAVAEYDECGLPMRICG